MAATTLITLGALLSSALLVNAESHTVKFINQCGSGTPQLLVGGQVVSSGEDYTSNGPINSAIAYLQTADKKCGMNGENCTLMELNMNNPACPGCGSSSDLSLIPPHAYSVETSFAYYGGCNGQGATCDSPTCNTAFFQPNDNQVQVACQDDNVNLLIAFCADASDIVNSGFQTAAAPSSTTAAAPSSSPAAATSTQAAVPTTAAVSSSLAASPSAIINVAPSPSAASSSAAPAASSSSSPKCKRSSKAKAKRRAAKEAKRALEAHKRMHAARLTSDH